MKLFERLLATLLITCVVGGIDLHAQQPLPPEATATDAGTQLRVPRVIRFAGTVARTANSPDAVTISFALYKDQQGGTALWLETQNVRLDATGRYTVLLGANSAEGVPLELFTAAEARWLGVQVENQEERPRALLVSAPYALKAADADTLGGKPLSAFVLAGSANSGSVVSAGPLGSSTGNSAEASTATASGGTPQPATDFTDTNATEVLLVTQLGDGYAIRAVSNGASAVFAHNSGAGDAATMRAENENPNGTAITGAALASSGQTTGVLGTAASPDGTAGVFKNSGGGTILSLQGSSGEVASINGLGQITAWAFFGDGRGLFDIPNSATTATSGADPNTIVARDSNGNFWASAIHAERLAGDARGLFNIPNSATTATSSPTPDTIVARDATGSFSGKYVYADSFWGEGSGLHNIPNSATTATNASSPNTIVARDANGNFAANEIYATTLWGSGRGLIDIPNRATTATEGSYPGTIVARDVNGDFAANQVYAAAFHGNGSFLSGVSADNAQHAVTADTANNASALGGFAVPSFARVDATNQFSSANTFNGNVDMSGASATLPVKSVLSADTPTACSATKELLIKTDAPAGQQLFICNAEGNGYVLLGDGSANGVMSVSSSDPAINVGGTAIAPVLSIPNGSITGTKLADGTLPPSKVAGTAAILGANAFTADQTIQANLTVWGRIHAADTIDASSGMTTGQITAGRGTYSANDTNSVVSVTQAGTGTALTATSGQTGVSADGTRYGIIGNSTSGWGVYAKTINSVGLYAEAGNDGSYPAIFVQKYDSPYTKQNVIVGRLSTKDVFKVNTGGDLFASGAILTSYPNGSPATALNRLAKLAGGSDRVVLPAVGDTTGIVGVVMEGAGYDGNAQVAFAGIAQCLFDNATNAGNYVTVSNLVAGYCHDAGSAYPTSGQVLGRVLVTSAQTTSPLKLVLFGTELRGANSGTVTRVATGQGLTGGPITGNGTISIAEAGVTNSMLQNSSMTVVPGAGLSGGGTTALGGTVSLTNSGVLSFNGRAGAITPQSGDYGFAEIAGTLTPEQMPALTGDVVTTAGSTTTSLSVSGVNPGTYTKLTVDGKGRATAGAQASFADLAGSAAAAQLPAAVAYQDGANTFTANQTVNGMLTAAAFSGNGAALSDVNAASVNGFTSASFAQLATANTFTANQTINGTLIAATFGGNGAGLTDVNAASVNGLTSAAFAQLAAANTFQQKQTFVPSGANAASLSLPAGSAPTSPVSGDVWSTGGTVQYQDGGTTRTLVSTTQSGGFQLLKFTASITPTSVSAAICKEQSFTVTGITTGDLIIGVAQPPDGSPGTNIAIGGWRVVASDTVAVQFCNVGKSSSTPRAGTYTFAVMR